jgi:zinc protease
MSWLALPILAALAAPAVGAAPTAGATDAVFPYPLDVKVLPNGLTVVVVPMATPGLVSMRTAVRTGARDEVERGHTGFAHFFEHMMFRGTKRFPQDVYARFITSIGADSNAYTSTDVTVYQLDVAKEDLARVLEIEADRFMNLDYAEDVFRTEAGAVFGEYRKNRSSPGFQLHEAMRAKAFTRHTYAHTTIGFAADIAAMPTRYAYSKSFFSRFYRPENVILVLAGDLDSGPAFAEVERWWGAWKRGYVAPKVPREPVQAAERRVEVSYEGRSLPMLAVAWKGPAAAAADRGWVASLVLADLAFGRTSELYRKLVLEEQVLQSLSVSPAGDRDPGLWQVSATVKKEEDVEAVLRRILEEAERFRTTPPTAEAVTAVKSNLRYGFLMGLDTPAAVAGELADTFAVHGSVFTIEDMFRTLATVTPEDVQRAADSILQAKTRTIGILRGKKG